jgi:hypothetical protein
MQRFGVFTLGDKIVNDISDFPKTAAIVLEQRTYEPGEAVQGGSALQ